MNPFAVGMNTYLSFAQELTNPELDAIGLSPKKRDQLLKASYPYRMVAGGPAIAQFKYSERKSGKDFSSSHLYEYRSDLHHKAFNQKEQEKRDVFIAAIAGHEANHSTRKKWKGIRSANLRLLGSAAVGFGAAVKMYNYLDEIGATEAVPIASYGFTAAAGFVAGLVTNVFAKNTINHFDERKAHKHQGVVEVALNKNPESLDDLKEKAVKIKEKIGFFEQMKAFLFDKGYPSKNTQELFITQGKIMAHKAGIVTDDKRNHYEKTAAENLKKEKFKMAYDA